MEMKQTAVEWLGENIGFLIPSDKELLAIQIINQAKEMQKQQIIEAYTDGTNYNKSKKLIITPDDEDYKLGKQYYNETFNK
jgi:hypothetical protein